MASRRIQIEAIRYLRSPVAGSLQDRRYEEIARAGCAPTVHLLTATQAHITTTLVIFLPPE